MIPGWSVARTIPYETLIGLATGKYQLYGGVIRWAPGTPNAGQIVRHLIPVGLNPLGIIPGLDFKKYFYSAIALSNTNIITK
ncbi:MAG: hypothetical protein ACRC2R_14260 [Xenococcaceae cyanobacterium]